MTPPINSFNRFTLFWSGVALIIAVLLAMCGCGTPEAKPEKPFIIYDIYWYASDKTCHYYYYDNNGQRLDFEDQCSKYSIGDTIK